MEDELLLFGEENLPDPLPVHECVIFQAWEDDDTGLPDYDFNLIHPDGCGGDECLVGMQFSEGGYLWEVLCDWIWPRERQVYPWVTTYYVKGWTSKHDVPGYPVEYDWGVHVSLKKEDL